MISGSFGARFENHRNIREERTWKAKSTVISVKEKATSPNRAVADIERNRKGMKGHPLFWHEFIPS